MDFAEYIEKVSKKNLTDSQKIFLKHFEKVRISGEICCVYPMRTGKTYILQMWRMYMEELERIK